MKKIIGMCGKIGGNERQSLPCFRMSFIVFFRVFVILSFSIFLFPMSAQCSNLKSDVGAVISRSSIHKGSIAVSVKDFSNGKTVYELNSKMPIPPASIQKITTFVPAYLTLGSDYAFSTKIYKNRDNEYILVLGADPYLTSKDLDKLIKSISKEQNGIFIDDSVIDQNEWGEGWQWDDDLNPLMPKFSAYNIDKNLLEIVISPTVNGFPAEITMDVSYPITFKNNIITSKETQYTMLRQNHISPDVINMDGTIKYNKSDIRKITVNNPQKYFKLRMSNSIINHGISSSGIYKFKKAGKKCTLITQISHSIETAKTDILKNSDNLVSETVFKLAGGKYSNQTGSFENGLKMFNDFCKKQKLDISHIHLADASGVSKNNLMTADFMTEFLKKNAEYVELELPTAGEGTLSNRMLYLKNILHAKTGTLSNLSSIAGYITSKTNHKYVFCIMINNSKSTESDKKVLEEYIIRTLYTKG